MPEHYSIDDLLMRMATLNASDLHVSVSSVPVVRLRGHLEPIEGIDALSAEGEFGGGLIVPGAVAAARLLHGLAGAGFAGFAWMIRAGWGLWVGVALAGALLIWQHSLVAPGRLERLDTAFFTANGALSVLMLALYLLDMMVRP